jgi:tetratricopeptide (TPR) repeat protein
MPESAPGTRKDFFISYNKADRAWAEWIAWQLEDVGGYSVTIEAWDFGAGSNFALEMDRALRECERLIAVLSPEFLAAQFTQPEWAAYFAQDPKGEKGLLVPVRVRACEVPAGLLRAVVYIDLVGSEEKVAASTLLDGVQLGRRKPTTAPSFPGRPPRAMPSGPRFPGTLPDIWNVPHLRNPNFTEPEGRLTEIRAALCSGRPAALTQAMTGLGGVGKTQFAVEYAYRYGGEYALVWWLRAQQPAALAAEYAALATPLDLPEKDATELPTVIAAVRAALQHRADWLLIFDNANAPAEIRDYLPGAGGHVLITSRNPAWGSVARRVEVKKWPAEVAVAFLLQRTGQVDTNAAEGLARELDFLPLALEQAAAYVEATGTTLADYRALFRTHASALLQRGAPGADYPATVATTWELSFQKVEEESPAAAALLHLCAFFAPDDIPRDVMTAGAGHLPEPLRAAVGDPFAFDEAVAAIRRYSLIEAGDAATLSLHRLVQAVIRDRLGKAGQKPWAEAAVKVVDSAFPFDSVDVRTWKGCARLLPQAIATTDFAEQFQVGLEAATRLLNQMGLYARGRAEYATAKAACERALKIGEQAFGHVHPQVAIRVNNLGGVLQDLGDLPGAKAAFERALKIDEKVFGPDHPKVAIRVNNLGSVLQDLGDLPGAKEAFERALKIDEKVFGPDHPDVATGVSNLGDVLRASGDLPGAKAAYERALAVFQKYLGDDHPNTKAVRRNLEALGDDAR